MFSLYSNMNRALCRYLVTGKVNVGLENKYYIYMYNQNHHYLLNDYLGKAQNIVLFQIVVV